MLGKKFNYTLVGWRGQVYAVSTNAASIKERLWSIASDASMLPEQRQCYVEVTPVEEEAA